jgi:hypothetical protein
MLQIDLKSAYESINFDLFSKFLVDVTDNHPATKILLRLLRAFSNAKGGLPFINDSVFFLGNAYFNVVDKIIGSHKYEFVRFVDDYRIFGPTLSELENMLLQLRKDLRGIGFEINDQKLKLGTGEEYLEVMANSKYVEIPATEYHNAFVQMDLPAPQVLLQQVLACLQNPEDKLHQGFGRMLMATLRTMRIRTSFAEAQGGMQESLPEDSFYDLLAQNSEALMLITKRLDEYQIGSANRWRLVWILYLCRNLTRGRIEDAALGASIFTAIDKISDTQTIDPVCRLWATRTTVVRSPEDTVKVVEQIHALEYEKAGRAWYGISVAN